MKKFDVYRVTYRLMEKRRFNFIALEKGDKLEDKLLRDLDNGTLEDVVIQTLFNEMDISIRDVIIHLDMLMENVHEKEVPSILNKLHDKFHYQKWYCGKLSKAYSSLVILDGKIYSSGNETARRLGLGKNTILRRIRGDDPLYADWKFYSKRDEEKVHKYYCYRVNMVKPNGDNLFYIGQSSKVNNRLRYHETDLNRGAHHNKKMQEFYNNNEDVKLSLEIVGEFPSRKEAYEYESYLIKKYDGDPSLANLMETTEFTDEHWVKIAATLTEKRLERERQAA